MKIFAVGSHCIDPPIPDDKHSLELVWNEKYPPKHNETVLYVCNAGTTWNRFQSDFSQDSISLTCLPENKFEEVKWPTCIDGKFVFNPLFHFYLFS